MDAGVYDRWPRTIRHRADDTSGWSNGERSHTGRNSAGRFAAEFGDGREELPLVFDWLERGGVQEHGCAVLPAPSLQRKRNEVPEGAFRHEILRREQAIVRGEINLGPQMHCVAEHTRTDLAGGRSRHTVGKEHPHVRAVARTGSFQHGRDLMVSANLDVGERVERPRGAVEIACQQPARVARQQWVQADRLFTREVCLDHLGGQRKVLPIGSASVRDAAFHCRGPSGTTRRVLPPHRIHVRAPDEQRLEQRHLVRPRQPAPGIDC